MIVHQLDDPAEVEVAVVELQDRMIVRKESHEETAGIESAMAVKTEMIDVAEIAEIEKTGGADQVGKEDVVHGPHLVIAERATVLVAESDVIVIALVLYPEI